MAEPIFAVEGLTMRFAGLTAIDDLSLDVERGSIHAVIGPNGAGKSTFFNCISRFYEPSAGRVTFDGADLGRYARHQIAGLGIARTFQNLELFKALSVFENVRLGLYSARGRDGDAGRETETVDAILERVGLVRWRDEPAGNLDFGAQKLVELARALAVRPRVLLLDEPAAGLRKSAIQALDRLLVELAHEDGLTIILVEHVMALVMSISDRITVLNFGRKIAEGTPAEIRADARVVEAYLGKRAAAHA